MRSTILALATGLATDFGSRVLATLAVLAGEAEQGALRHPGQHEALREREVGAEDRSAPAVGAGMFL
jgi:hypothetical protein